MSISRTFVFGALPHSGNFLPVAERVCVGAFGGRSTGAAYIQGRILCFVPSYG